jgi:FKBP-type peptidyl-prolyl cis-trans isomerase FkpA
VINRVLLFLLFSIFFISCSGNQQEKKLSDAEIRERMTNVNKLLVRDESKDIEEFIERHQWKLQTTGTGLRFQSYEKGEGRQPKHQDTVAIAYDLYLLDGTLCYSADENQPLRFILGRKEQPAGLEEGLMMMHEGERARMVVPSHLAHGMAGDENKIPAGSSLYYDVKLLTVNSH